MAVFSRMKNPDLVGGCKAWVESGRRADLMFFLSFAETADGEERPVKLLEEAADFRRLREASDELVHVEHTILVGDATNKTVSRRRGGEPNGRCIRGPCRPYQRQC